MASPSEIAVANSSRDFAVNQVARRRHAGPEPAPCYLSVVVPVFNERDNLEELFERTERAIGRMQIPFELIFVDDGSSDGSLEVLRAVAARAEASAGWVNVKICVFRRNYGQTAALAAGFQYATGSIVVAMDADLQNDPDDIPVLVQRIEEGADVVSGWRRDRQDDLTRRIPSIVANWVINRLISGTGVRLHDYGCTLKAYRREVVQNLSLYGEMHRFIPAFAAWLGVRVEEVEVRHHARTAGVSKYGISRVSTVLLDFVTVRFFSDHLTKPIQFFAKIAAMFILAGLLLCGALMAGTLFFGWPIGADAFIGILSLTTILGFQGISLGLLGEMHMRSYFELQDKDPYVIREVIESASPVAAVAN